MGVCVQVSARACVRAGEFVGSVFVCMLLCLDERLGAGPGNIASNVCR